MRVLVIGGGGREHALAWLLRREAEVLCTPGNAGIAGDVECLSVKPSDRSVIVDLCRSRKVDLIVVGPEDPLIDGLGDRLRGEGFAVYGPDAAAARLEGSKAFSKNLMARAGVPTAAFGAFDSVDEAREFAKARFGVGRQVAVKASGNALGKGVTVCDTVDDAMAAIDRMMVAREFGVAGATVVVEDRLMGREFSLLTMVSDEGYASLPIAQDHKRAYDDDQGPNTGGMGAYSPVAWVGDELVRETERRVVEPILRALRADGIGFRGTLFSGLMLDGNELNCLEYNVRFGDPEMETIAPRIGGGFLQALDDCAHGRPVVAPSILNNASVCVVMASPGYPAAYPKGLPIRFGPLPEGVKVFHAGTAAQDGCLVTNGGRVLAVTAQAAEFEAARRLAYEACGAIEFDGAHYRRDIGALASC